MTDEQNADAAGELDLAQAERELHDAIAGVLSKHGMMVTKWLLGAEGLDNTTGERALETFTSPDFRSWDGVGILGFLQARENGIIGAEAAGLIEEEDEDEGS